MSFVPFESWDWELSKGKKNNQKRIYIGVKKWGKKADLTGADVRDVIELVKHFEKNNPNWKIESAKKFANKKKLGRFGDIQNKKKDLAKMARAGFDYETAKKILENDWLVFKALTSSDIAIKW